MAKEISVRLINLNLSEPEAFLSLYDSYADLIGLTVEKHRNGRKIFRYTPNKKMPGIFVSQQKAFLLLIETYSRKLEKLTGKFRKNLDDLEEFETHYVNIAG